MEDIGPEFIRKTRYPDFSTVDLIKRVPQPPFELPVPEGAVVQKLPDPGKVPVRDIPVKEAFDRWEHIMFFNRSSITLEELSFLLWYTQGVRGMVSDHITIRNIPSSGSRYPLETYFVAQEVEGLKTGLYRYLPLSHSIVTEREDTDILLEIATASMTFQVVTRAAVTFLYVAIPYRATWALGNRGYRSVLLDAGHTCQALIFAAACIGCGARPIDLFHDEYVMNLARLDPETQWPVCLAAIGKNE